MANQIIMKLDMRCDKCKQVALDCVNKICGIDSVAIDMSQKTLTVLGDADPVEVAKKIRKKFRCAIVLYAGPLKKKEKEKEKEEKDKDKEKKVSHKEKEVVVIKAAVQPWPCCPPCNPPCNACTSSKPCKPCSPPCNACTSSKPCRPCSPPCTSSKPCRPDILWPTYHPACSSREVWYVWNEEQHDPCAIC